MNINIFRSKLIEKYGEWDKSTAQFGNTSYGDIANDLCYSNSHFSKLLSGNGSDAMYVRGVKNINQLIKLDSLSNKITQLKAAQKELKETKNNPFKIMRLVQILAGLLLFSFLFYQFGLKKSAKNNNEMIVEANEHPLDMYFKPKDGFAKSPYLNSSEVHDYCPCSGYEGTWNLDKSYKMPLPSNKPGLYYVAKSADIRMKCQKATAPENKGKELLGFENIHNEIWLDKTRSPFAPEYFDAVNKSYTEAFIKLNFEDNENFIKIANVYSCFFNEFIIKNDSIIRYGEPCGRYAEVIDEAIIKKYKIDISELMDNVIGNMTYTSCNAATNNYCNPNKLKEGESVFSFECLFSIRTENLGFGGGYPYTKGFRLVEQNYSSNLLCGCGEG